MIEQAIKKLVNQEDLTYSQARQVMDELMSGQASAVQTASYLTALAMKGETVAEITASAEGMRAAGTKIHPDRPVVEIVGTGGDHSNSFNISTTASLIVAAAGVPVAKHGNRAASSKSGAADCLEALGVKIDLAPQQNEQVLKNTNICFLFAKRYHSAMRFVGPVRKELGIRTIFNILGPLTSPASASCQVMGVFDEKLVQPLAHVLHQLGVDRGMVVFGQDGLDEISLSAPTTVCEINGDQFTNYVIKPADFGYSFCTSADLIGGTPEENAAITRAILDGQEQGPKRQAVCLNAGAALYIAGAAPDLKAGVKLAEQTIDCGAAAQKLQQFITITNQEALA
ncbi:anthranilate phosphoribosyltransferase [Limosilactobacillus allomucosae]|uniref:Anthranilate phosphoribosyltransferase n=1 Tax=Limosilactobacillus allomucosae TaxID=3142938 RepID=A0AAU7C0F6_9LACO